MNISGKMILFCAVIISIVFGSLGGCDNSNQSESVIRIISEVPSDIKGGAPNANLRSSSIFAWQEFIALSWPALGGTRDTPDENELFGDPNFTGPLVWQTYRGKVEIYPGKGNPHGFVNDPAQSFGYNDVPPKYVYADGEVEPCEGQTAAAEPAWVNLDEISQIGLASMFAGSAPDNSASNDDPKLVRFLAKGNLGEYVYVVDPVTSLFSHTPAPSDEPYWDLAQNFQQVANGNGDPSQLQGPVISFPPGTIEVKAAFRELTPAEKDSGRFYQTRVRYYEQDSQDPNQACYREAVWGLIGLHIIHKTPSAPWWIYATFEQTDNLLTPDGAPVENENGEIINPAPAKTTPALTYTDGNPPMLDIVGDQYCENIGGRLYYHEIAANGGLPSGGDICVNERDHTIPPTVVEINRLAHDVIAEYGVSNGIEPSVWLNYRLTNVQWVPFDITRVNDTDPDSNFGDAVYYTNNIVIETDYSLQNFGGRIYFDMPADGGPPTNLPPNFNNFDPDRLTYQNVLSFDNEGNLQSTFNMGGCMGCHGAAQEAGTDFSFILAGGRVAEPEAPDVTPPGTTNPPPDVHSFKQILGGQE